MVYELPVSLCVFGFEYSLYVLIVITFTLIGLTIPNSSFYIFGNTPLHFKHPGKINKCTLYWLLKKLVLSIETPLHFKHPGKVDKCTLYELLKKLVLSIETPLHFKHPGKVDKCTLYKLLKKLVLSIETPLHFKHPDRKSVV